MPEIHSFTMAATKNHVIIDFSEVKLWTSKKSVQEVGMLPLKYPWPVTSRRKTGQMMWNGIHHFKNPKRPAEISVLVWYDCIACRVMITIRHGVAHANLE